MGTAGSDYKRSAAGADRLPTCLRRLETSQQIVDIALFELEDPHLGSVPPNSPLGRACNCPGRQSVRSHFEAGSVARGYLQENGWSGNGENGGEKICELLGIGF